MNRSRVPALTPERLLDLQSEITSTEIRLGAFQSGFRLLASTWLLAGLGGIGFCLTGPELAGLPARRVAGILGVAGSIGILLLWTLDVRVYQRLVSANFNEGLALETAFPWLPQIRTQIRARFRGALTRIVSGYYFALSVVFWIIGSMLLFSPLESALWPISLRAGAIALGGAAVIGIVIYATDTASANMAGTPLTRAVPFEDRVAAYRRLRIFETGAAPPQNEGD